LQEDEVFYSAQISALVVHVNGFRKAAGSESRGRKVKGKSAQG